jgi:hypothetical protein
LEDKLTEIAVDDDQNPSLFPGDFKDVFIGKTRRIVTRDNVNVMSKLTKVRNKPEVGALVEQEFHRAASERTPFGGFGETSSPVTSACAYARHACTSARVRSGWAASNSPISGLWESSSSTKPTAMRVPLTTGFPARIRGSVTIRSR